VLRVNRFQRDRAYLQSIAGSKLVDGPGCHFRGDAPQPDRDDEDRLPGQRANGRGIQVVPVAVAHEHG